MKNLGLFLTLFFLLVKEIYSVKLCFPPKYKKYETIFRNAFINQGNSIEIEFDFNQSIDTYLTGLSLYNCNIVVIEPSYYDEYYSNFADINKQIKDVLEERKNDQKDGEIYKELLKDLRFNDYKKKGNFEETIRAVPLFMDYGILYYRNDVYNDKPSTWTNLSYITEDLSSKENFETIYHGQFSDAREFYYNLIENVVNTDDELSYSVIERETNSTLHQFKELIDGEIINETANTYNSEAGVQNFKSGKIMFMRNWSSYLQEITDEFSKNENKTFDKSKIFYSEKYGSSKSVNKGIYLSVFNSGNEEIIANSVEVIKTFTNKDFMKFLIEQENFYDLPAYGSLISEDGTVNNKAYCDRINCEFFRELQQNHVVAAYDVFYQTNFLKKFKDFFKEVQIYFNGVENGEDEVSLEHVMSKFSDYFQDKFIDYSSTTAIIMYSVIAVEILITLLVAYYIIKYRNFIEIRRSSPLFLIIMLFGIILAFASIITFIGKPNDYICIIRPYVFVLAFGLTFYSLLLKTFRIKVIFDKVDIKVKDSNLILYLSIILGIELILVTVWTLYARLIPDVNPVNDEIHYYTCKNTDIVGVSIQRSLIAINGLALLYGCYLAYKVKNVYSEYNESKVIGLSIYGIVICMIILMFIVHIHGIDLITIFLIESLMIILSADIILVFIFTPKLWKLHINNISELPYEKPMYI